MTVIELRTLRAGDAERAGTKATTLAELAREGYPVPIGFVVATDAFAPDGTLDSTTRGAVLEAARRLGASSLAVRSSAISEDLPGASFAGCYLTVLDVRGDEELLDAIARVRASGRASRVAAPDASGEVAVLVQPMLRATAAGVAFTADPVTGDRGVTVVSAVRGLGERLVGGEANAEEWRQRGDSIERVRGGENAIDAERARAVAELARRIAAQRQAPQDIEWALAEGRLYVLQARPMTALPDAARWDAPPGAYARNFRLGEWLGDPVTPLFESWLLTTMEETMHADYAVIVGQPAPRPLHAVVNGWYFYSLNFLPASLGAVLRMLPGILRRLPRDARRVAAVFPPTARFGVDVFVAEWREQLLPTYRKAVERAAIDVGGASPQWLCALIDDLAVIAGHYFTSITFVAGYGWKTEIPLAQFYRRHLSGTMGEHPQLLLRGLVPTTDVPPHAASSLDWYFPTLGEAELSPDAGAAERHARLAAEREELERRARAALPARLAAKFDGLLAEAKRAAALREEQVRDLTLAWPVFRHALARLGESLVAHGALADPGDVYFLIRDELRGAVDGASGDLRSAAAARRARWARQRRLVPPLVLGALPRMLETLLGAADRALRDPVAESANAIRGIPASPGRVTGRARIVREPAEFDRLAAGEILVCPLTTPAWTPLFARAAAVVADVGSPAAHTSIIAREYGIPAVVGTRDGTARIPDGAVVTVDGGAGVVIPQ